MKKVIFLVVMMVVAVSVEAAIYIIDGPGGSSSGGGYPSSAAGWVNSSVFTSTSLITNVSGLYTCATLDGLSVLQTSNFTRVLAEC